MPSGIASLPLFQTPNTVFIFAAVMEIEFRPHVNTVDFKDTMNKAEYRTYISLAFILVGGEFSIPSLEEYYRLLYLLKLHPKLIPHDLLFAPLSLSTPHLLFIFCHLVLLCRNDYAYGLRSDRRR